MYNNEKVNNDDVLLEIKEYINNANNLIEDLIEDIRKNNYLEDLVDLLEGLTYCIFGLKAIKQDEIEVSIENLQRNLTEITEGIENRDFNLIADIVEYEMLEILNDLNENLQMI